MKRLFPTKFDKVFFGGAFVTLSICFAIVTFNIVSLLQEIHRIDEAKSEIAECRASLIADNIGQHTYDIVRDGRHPKR